MGLCKLMKGFNRKEKFIFLALSLTYVLMVLPPTIENPLLPPEAARYGISSGTIGIMFSSAAVISVLSSIAEGFLISKWGPKIVVLCGICFNGIFNIFFGLLVLFKSRGLFTAGCFVCMGMDSIGQTAIYTATVSYGTQYFPSNMGFVMGTLELYESSAEVIAFIFGGLMSQERGLLLPFVLFGALQLVAFPIDLFVLPKDADLKSQKPKEIVEPPVVAFEPKEIEMQAAVDLNTEKSLDKKSSFSSEDKTIVVISGPKSSQFTILDTPPPPDGAVKRPWRLILVPEIIFLEMTILINGIAWSFLNSTLEPHLSPLHLTKLQVNLVFLLTSLTYGISSPIWGWVSDKINSRIWIFTSIGLILAGIGFGLLGPVPFLRLQNTIWLNCVALIVTSSALSMAGVPASAKIHVYALEADFQDSRELQGIVSGVISTTYCIGMATGPLAGGYLLEKFKYPISAGLCGLLILFGGVVTLLYFLICHKKKKKPMRENKINDKISTGHTETIIIWGFILESS